MGLVFEIWSVLSELGLISCMIYLEENIWQKLQFLGFVESIFRNSGAYASFNHDSVLINLEICSCELCVYSSHD